MEKTYSHSEIYLDEHVHGQWAENQVAGYISLKRPDAAVTNVVTKEITCLDQQVLQLIRQLFMFKYKMQSYRAYWSGVAALLSPV